jgi:hypothetical protein
MNPRPNADFLRGLLVAYALYLAWINLGALWLGLGLWIKYHRYVPIQVWGSLALCAAYVFVCGALAFPGRRRLLTAAIVVTITALLPLVVIASWWKAGPAAVDIPAFLRNEVVRLTVAWGAWHLFRTFRKEAGR